MPGCGPCGCGLGPLGKAANVAGVPGPIYGNTYGTPFECSENVYPAITQAILDGSGYYRPGGYGYVFGYGRGYGSIHDGFRSACCFPYYFPGAQCKGCRPGIPALPFGYSGWW